MIGNFSHLPATERADFEAACAAHVLSAADFSVHVHQPGDLASHVAVKRTLAVTRKRTGIVRRYAGGLRENWIEHFRADLKRGVFR